MSKENTKRLHKQGYRQSWETNPILKDWIQAVPDMPDKAYCRYCQRTLYAHRYSVLKHTCTIKHQQNVDKFKARPPCEEVSNVNIEYVEKNNCSEVEITAPESKQEIEKYEEDCPSDEYTQIEQLDEPCLHVVITTKAYMDTPKEDSGNELQENNDSHCDMSEEINDCTDYQYEPDVEVRIYLESENLPKKALLLLDNTPSHPPIGELCSDDGQIVTMFLPPNVTALIQPMDQNVIRLTKLYYRTSLLSMVVSKKDKPVNEILKELTMRDAVTYLASAWNKVQSSTIRKCWRDILNPKNSEFTEVDDIPLSRYIETVNPEVAACVAEAAIILQELTSTDLLPAIDINVWTNGDVDAEENDDSDSQSDDENLMEVSKKTISQTDAIKSVNLLLTWALENDAEFKEIAMLRKIREKAVLTNLKSTKQKHITNYFGNSSRK